MIDLSLLYRKYSLSVTQKYNNESSFLYNKNH